MITFVLSALLSVAVADYSPLYESLVDGKYDQFRQKAFAELERENSLARKFEILKVISAHKTKFYGVDDFTGRALPFASERCQPAPGSQAVCSSAQGLDFILSNNENRPAFMVKAKDLTLVNVAARSRTLLAAPDLSFGRTLHLIMSERKRGEFFLLVREIEKQSGIEQPIRQTMHVFRFRGTSGCKVLEADVTESDGKYTLIEEFIHVLGDQASCQKSPLQI